ncbi:MAG: hypothetical protein ABW321_20260 [Polyangiales bacterium]
MASTLDSILDLVKRKVAQNTEGRRSGAAGSGGLLGQLTDFISQRTGGASRSGKHNVRPATEDPYGDPADAKGARNVKPASEDPYGDPADKK